MRLDSNALFLILVPKNVHQFDNGSIEINLRESDRVKHVFKCVAANEVGKIEKDVSVSVNGK